MRLHRRYKRMPDLMIGNNKLLLIREHGILLLIPSDDNLDALLEISLIHDGAAISDSPQRCLIYYIRKLCATCTGCGTCDDIPVYRTFYLHILRMNKKNRLSSLKIRQLYRDKDGTIFAVAQSDSSGLMWGIGYNPSSGVWQTSDKNLTEAQIKSRTKGKTLILDNTGGC